MNFKIWLEIVELNKPYNKVVKKSIIKDKGTNVAHRIIQYEYTTKLGNEIKLQFNPRGNDSYSIIFYVNDVLYDYGSKLGLIQNNKVGRDTEILPSVFYLIKTKADKLGAKYLDFHSTRSDNDVKIIRNLDIEPYKKQALNYLNQFLNDINNYKVNMIPPSQNMINIHQKINKPIPESRPDLNKKEWIEIITKLKSKIENNEENIEDYIDNFYNAHGTGRLGSINPIKIISALKDYSNAVKSNTERGFHREKNRRTAIYTRILNKYFTDDWHIDIKGNNFDLTRKI